MDENENETMSISDKVEILSTEDEKLKAIGEILSSDSSRKILKLLFNQSLTANQLASETGISLPLVIYHLKKMQEAQVVKITNVGKNTKSHDMKYYTIDKFAIVILPTAMSSTAKQSKSLFNSFSRIHRLATLGAASIAAWFSSQFIQIQSPGGDSAVPDDVAMRAMPETAMTKEAPMDAPMTAPAEESGDFSLSASVEQDTSMMMTPTSEPTLDILWSIIAVLGVIIAGLVIEVVISKRLAKTKLI